MAADLTGTPEDGVATPEAQREAYLAALKSEAEGYKLHGNKEREQAVAAEIKRVRTEARKAKTETTDVDEPEAEQATVE